ncbi:MAG TPA: sensor histidine kinase [Mycobacteriales bacterium]
MRIRRCDVLVATVLLVVQVGGTLLASRGQPDRRPLDALAFVLLAAAPLSFLARGWSPLVPLCVALPATAVYFARDHPRGPIVAGLAIALVTTVLGGRRRWAWGVSAAGLAAAAVAAALGLVPWVHVTVALAWLLVVLLAADQVRYRRERAAAQREARREEARRVADEERLALARDLHDVLAHSLSVINVQAGVALHLIDDDPGQVRSALAAIKQTSRDALAEVRQTVGALRAGGEVAPRAPAPGLADLDQLLATTTAAGLRAEADVRGAPRPLPAAVDLAAYRVVQEALTNVARHSASDWAEVRVTYAGGGVRVEVTDDGPPRPAAHAGAGHGLLGMRERASSLGGTVSSGPRPGGGYGVTAWFPT